MYDHSKLPQNILDAVVREGMAWGDYGQLVYAQDVTEPFFGRTIIRHSAGDPVTDPYGSLAYGLGDEDNFINFDYAIFDDFVVLDASVNSETGSFIMGFAYEVCTHDEAVAVAQSMVDRAYDWCSAGGDDEIDLEGWNHGDERFIADLKADLDRLGHKKG